jgi:hypothetical protein
VRIFSRVVAILLPFGHVEATSGTQFPWWKLRGLTTNPIDTTTYSNSSSLVTRVLESLACSYDSPMIHTRKATSRLLALTSYVMLSRLQFAPFLGRIGADIIWCRKSGQSNSTARQSNFRLYVNSSVRSSDLIGNTVGHGWPRTIPNHHLFLLPWRSWHLCSL